MEPQEIRFQIPAIPKKALWLAGAILALVVLGFASWRLFTPKPAVFDPFTDNPHAAVGFTLYYPTHLPKGYRIDAKSVAKPRDAVVTFTVEGPNNQKIFFSEIPRPTKFDLGSYYKTFADRKEIPVSDGAIDVGRVDNNKLAIASRANNSTWVLANTSANVSQAQMIDLLKYWQSGH